MFLGAVLGATAVTMAHIVCGLEVSGNFFFGALVIGALAGAPFWGCFHFYPKNA
jgi:hypothetical protein